VSCSSPLGLTAQEALDICYVSGRRNEVRLIDFSEFNPTVGNSEKTVKLMAAMAYQFLVGLTQRSATRPRPHSAL
jgi:formiminoglutamase